MTRSFGALKAVNALSFDVEPGIVFGIGGPNGAGKTTLFDLICGVTPLSSGDIWFQGKQISNLRSFEVCHEGIARTFQLNAAFETMTVMENVLVATQHGHGRSTVPRMLFTHSERQWAKQIVEQVGLQDCANETVSRLQLVETKLLMIAAAIATRPKMLLLDEPVGGLIPSEIDRVERVIRGLTENQAMTVMLIEHVMRFLVGLSDQVMIMHHGELLYRGTADGLANDRRVVETYLGEGTSARIRSTPAQDAAKAGHGKAEVVAAQDSDPWSLKVEATARQLLRQHQSGRIYPIDFLKLERILSERTEDDRPTALTRVARELIQTRLDKMPTDQKFEMLSRVFTETQFARKTAAPSASDEREERENAIKTAARKLLSKMEKEGRFTTDIDELRVALAELDAAGGGNAAVARGEQK
uniref:ABC transporter ATP-binding protein n=1 Tax=Aminobacter niigataensis TaxID=83265 RepID=UPI002852C5C5|nr:ATP-binding cassette domain-containing protein [Aminobacter niigataensis]